jgi:hypothetical protein
MLKFFDGPHSCGVQVEFSAKKRLMREIVYRTNLVFAKGYRGLFLAGLGMMQMAAPANAGLPYKLSVVCGVVALSGNF